MSSEAQRYVDGIATSEVGKALPRQLFRTLYAIASFMGESPDKPDAHRICWAKQSTIARRAGASEKTVERHIKALISAKILAPPKRHCRPGDRRGGAVKSLRIVGFSPDQPDNVSDRSRRPNGHLGSTNQTNAPRPTGHGVSHRETKNKPTKPAGVRDGQTAAVSQPANENVRITATDPRFPAALKILERTSLVFADACRKAGFVDFRHDQLQRLER